MEPSTKSANEENWKPESALDVLMLLLYVQGNSGENGEPVQGITRLDKIMYLLSESPEFSDIIKGGYTFQADNFGPFAPELFDDIQALKQEEILGTSEKKTLNQIETADEESVEKVLDDAPDMDISWKKYSVETYKLTELGMIIAQKLYNSLTDSQRKRLTETKKTFGQMPLKNLLHFVYSTAPSKMLEKSKIRKQVLGY